MNGDGTAVTHHFGSSTLPAFSLSVVTKFVSPDFYSFCGEFRKTHTGWKELRADYDDDNKRGSDDDDKWIFLGVI